MNEKEEERPEDQPPQAGSAKPLMIAFGVGLALLIFVAWLTGGS